MSAAPWPTAMVTGHRVLSVADRQWMLPELERVMLQLIADRGVTTAVSGMALGPDTDWAELALLKELRLHAVIPFPNQCSPWKPEQQETWHSLIGSAAEVTEVSAAEPVDKAEAGRMLHARNGAMLKISDVVVAVADRRKLVRLPSGYLRGGTWSCVEKASGAGLPVIWLDVANRRTSVPSIIGWRNIFADAAPTR